MFHHCRNITRSNLICSRCTFRAALINGCNSRTQIKLYKAATCRRKGKFHSIICGVCHCLRLCIFMKSERGRSGEEEQECSAFILLLSFYNARQPAHKRGKQSRTSVHAPFTDSRFNWIPRKIRNICAHRLWNNKRTVPFCGGRAGAF